MQLHRNVGTIDRYLRIAAGVILIGLAVASVPAAPWQFVIAAAGAILLTTGFTGFCPIYAVLRLSTRPAER